MEDWQIVALYLNRDERAVACTMERYGSYCRAVSQRILGNADDAEECVNTVLQAAWSSIPPHQPEHLKTYLAKLTRRISLDALRRRDAAKRGGGQASLCLDELLDCLPDGNTPERSLEQQALTESLQRFLAQLPAEERRAFVLRYWHFYSMAEVAEQLGFSLPRTTSMLFRTRMKLKNHLIKEEWL